MRTVLPLLLLLSSCAPSLSGGDDDDDSTPPSEALDSGAATLSVTLLADDGREESVDVEADGFSLWFCGPGCFTLNANFDAFGTRLLAGYSFEASDPPAAEAGDIYYVNIRWDDDSRFARQGEHPNVEGSWGASPGGEIVIDGSCEDCTEWGSAASGSLRGESTATVYDPTTEAATGESLRLDAAVFRDLPLVY